MFKEDNRFYVYLHRRGDTNEVFYVGKGSGNRANSVRGRSNWWEKVYRKHGRTVEYVEKGLSEQEAFDLEVETIKFYRECNHPLCNLTDGGEGISGYVFTEDATSKISDAVSKEVICSNGMVFKSCRAAGEWLGKINSCTKISKCCRREGATAYGYVWRYTSDCQDLKESIAEGRDIFKESLTRSERPSMWVTAYCSNGMKFDSVKKAAEWLSLELGKRVDTSNVSKCCNGSRKSLYGFRFSYDDAFTRPLST